MRHSFLLVSLVSLPLAAQSHVIPHALTNAPGSSSTNFPLGNSTPGRVQYIYDNHEVGLTVPVTLRSLEIRALFSASNVAKSNIDLEISLGATPTPAAAATTSFANNRGPNHAVVYARRLTNLPPTTPSFPGQYSGPLPFDAPVLYAPTGNALLVEYDVASQPSGTWPMDTPFTGAGPHTSIGSGCGGLTASSTGGLIGNTLTFSLTGGIVGNPAVMLLGDLELPAPLPLPTPGCLLYQNALVTLSTSIASPTSVVIPLPNVRPLRGFVAYGQFGSIDAGMNLIASNSRRVVIAGLYDVARVYNNSSNTSPTGTVQQNVGIVTRFGL